MREMQPRFAGSVVFRGEAAVATARDCRPSDRGPLERRLQGSRLRQFGTAVVVLVAAVASTASGEALAGEPKPLNALAEGKLPEDRRLGRLRTLNDYFPMQVPETVEAWQRRREQLQRQVRVALGLWPWPTRTPLNAVVHGRVDRGDYTVEKVYFESYPGHFVTGNLYRPKQGQGPYPAVLCPHGHWPNGRFLDVSRDKVRWSIVRGEERFEQGGRSPLQARCVQLARMGCVVFHYDMVGYADSVQLAHRPGMREAMNTAQDWGFFSPQAELRSQNMMGLQAWNSIRALDFLCGLPEVDAERVAVTGASGGGTQTFILCAIDSRPKVAFPAVMVSTSMQGGCTCENACYLRIGAGNVDLAALFAPKPLGMTGADDWTREIETKGLPELKRLYQLLGVPDGVMAKALVQFKHNYNYVSREVMYHWFNRHLGLGLEEPIVEEDYEPLSREEMRVWDAAHPAPPGGEAHERALLRWMTRDAETKLAELVPHDAASLEAWRQVVGGAVDVMIGRDLETAGDVQFEKTHEDESGAVYQYVGLVRNATHGEAVPVVFLYPKQWNRRVVVWATPEGKRGLWDADGRLKAAVQRLLEAGTCVAGIDLLYQGEFLADGKPPQRQRMVGKALGNYAGFTFGYNHPLFAQRVHDLLSLIAMIRNDEHAPERVDLVGLGGAGRWVAAAAAQAGAAVGRVVVDTSAFRFASLKATDDVDFLPGIVKFGDLPALLALAAPREVLVLGEGERLPSIVEKVYAAAGQRANVQSDGASDDRAKAAAAAEWLLR